MEKISICIITPEATFFDGHAHMVIMRAADGDIGILPGHAPLITLLAQGDMVIINGNNRFTASVSGGFAEVLPHRAVVIAESAKWITEPPSNLPESV